MMSLAEYRRSASRLSDFLPWAALVAPGVVLNKDGSFQRTARFRCALALVTKGGELVIAANEGAVSLHPVFISHLGIPNIVMVPIADEKAFLGLLENLNVAPEKNDTNASVWRRPWP